MIEKMIEENRQNTQFKEMIIFRQNINNLAQHIVAFRNEMKDKLQVMSDTSDTLLVRQKATLDILSKISFDIRQMKNKKTKKILKYIKKYMKKEKQKIKLDNIKMQEDFL